MYYKIKFFNLKLIGHRRFNVKFSNKPKALTLKVLKNIYDTIYNVLYVSYEASVIIKCKTNSTFVQGPRW